MPELLCQLSFKGDLERIKQIFAHVNREQIAQEEMGVKNNHRKESRLVDSDGYLYRRSPLIIASERGHVGVCKYLICDQNANLEAKDPIQSTALIAAAYWDNTEVSKLLIENNANVKAQNTNFGHAAYWAARRGNVDVLKLLLAKDGSVIDHKGPFDKTPLIAASELRMVNVVKLLLGENANVNLRDIFGRTALECAKGSDTKAILLTFPRTIKISTDL